MGGFNSNDCHLVGQLGHVRVKKSQDDLAAGQEMKTATWSFYDLSTGLLSGAAFSGTEEELAGQLLYKGQGVGAYEGEPDHLCQKVCLKTGSILPHRPDPPWDGTDLTLYVWWWDSSVKRWILRPRLKKFKADKWAEIKAARDAEINAPLVTEFGTFDHSAGPQQAIRDMANYARVIGADVMATLANNTVRRLEPQQIAAVLAASHIRVQGQRQIASGLRAEIEAARTAECVAAIAWRALPVAAAVAAAALQIV